MHYVLFQNKFNLFYDNSLDRQ